MPETIPFPHQPHILCLLPSGRTLDRLYYAAQIMQWSVTQVSSLSELLQKWPQADWKGIILAWPQDSGEQLEYHQQCAPLWQAVPVITQGPVPCTARNAPFAHWDDQTSAIEMQAWLRAADTHQRVLCENVRLQRRWLQLRTSEMVGQSPAIERLRQQMQAVSAQTWPVALIGEPGTGREFSARLIHGLSERGHLPFLTLDCRLQTAQGLPRELFGSMGPQGPQAGRLEQSAGGTLFFKRLDELSQPCQQILVELLEQNYWTAAGTSREYSLSTRFIASTSAEMMDLVASKRVLPRLAAFFNSPPLIVPPLRQRLEDLPALTECLLRRQAQQSGLPAHVLDPSALELFQQHAWQGNIRELGAVLSQAIAINSNLTLTAENIGPWLVSSESQLSGFTLAEMERHLIEATFARFSGNRERTAQALQIGLRTLSGKLREYGYPPRGGPDSKRQAAERRAA